MKKETTKSLLNFPEKEGKTKENIENKRKTIKIKRIEETRKNVVIRQNNNKQQKLKEKLQVTKLVLWKIHAGKT